MGHTVGIVWTPERLEEARLAWEQEGTSARAAVVLSARWGVALPANTLRSALGDRGIPSPRPKPRKKAPPSSSPAPGGSPVVGDRGRGAVPKAGTVVPESGTAPESVEVDLGDLGLPKQEGLRAQANFSALVAAAKRPGATVTSVCNALDCSPASLERLVAEARAAGIAVELAGTEVGIRAAAPSDSPVEVAPPVGDDHVVGVFSDLHFGSKYCLRSQIRDFVAYAYESGVREILCAGDVLDGCYRHGRFELSHHGIDEQTDDARATLPELPGLTYHCIAGNHDQTFTGQVGLEVGPYIAARFREQGRDDLRFHGNASAYLRVRGATIHLWHPSGGIPYALSYRLQKAVEAYAPGLKPDVLAVGHLHKSCAITARGVHAFLVPSFQSGGSAFSNSLVGAPANGGLILRWRLTEHGTLRSLTSELVSYYHEERPREVA